MKKLTSWWKQFCFSVGAQINAVLLLMLILFLSFSIYNHSLFNQFNARYQKEIDQYYSILELKNHFLQSGILFEEYMKTGNRTTLAEFNDTYEKARSVIDILYTESTNEESWYLLRGIDQSFESYYSEAITGIMTAFTTARPSAVTWRNTPMNCSSMRWSPVWTATGS